jgi:2,3-bisphosphoglycerate-independent phosphoglycerate mutase
VNQGIVLVIVDGFGVAEASESNAISLSNMTTWDYLKANYPNTVLNASGNAVGLPDGVMGNSEVGHLTIGTGRIQYQSLELINRACKDNTLKLNSNITRIFEYLRNPNRRLHLMGLLSDGGVHSHNSHLEYLIKLFTKNIENKIFIHAITDGRDTSPTSGVSYVSKISQFIKPLNQVDLASIAGRYYAMDRDKKWDRTKIALDLYLKGIGEETSNPMELMRTKYDTNETDEFLKPIIVNPKGIIRKGDAVLFFNFRPDRARQITMAINGIWNEELNLKDQILYVTMTRYENNWQFPVLFDNPKIKNSLTEVISDNRFRQVHIAETEKYAHVTYFLNGGTEKDFPFEKRILIPSSKVATYDLEPEMGTLEIAIATKSEIEKLENKLIVVNIAAPDMVGHTGVIDATVKALEITDQAFELIYSSCKSNGYTLIITSDHGNCEKMIDNGNPHTAHTTNPVPFLITDNISLKQNMGLSNIAATILELLSVDVPDQITGESLITPN